MLALRFAAWFAPFALVLCSCNALEPQTCTEIGCANGFSLQAKTTSGALADGTYSITLQPEGGTAVRCTIVATDLSTNRDRKYLHAECDDITANVTLSAQVVCTEHRTEDAVGQSCTPIEGKWQIDVGLNGTPASVQVQIARDAVVLLERSVPLTYVESRPNGEGCEPLCRQASPEALVLPEP